MDFSNFSMQMICRLVNVNWALFFFYKYHKIPPYHSNSILYSKLYIKKKIHTHTQRKKININSGDSMKNKKKMFRKMYRDAV